MAVLFAMARSAFAEWSASRSTTWGTIPIMAGWCSAIAVPITSSSAISAGTDAQWNASRSAIAAWAAAAARSPVTICVRREPRSASAPAKIWNTTCAPEAAAITSPTSRAEPCRSSSTANGRATGAIGVPKAEISRAAKTRAKFGSRSGAKGDGNAATA